MFDKYLDYCAGNTCNNNTNNFLLAAMAGNGIEKEDIGTFIQWIWSTATP